MFANDRGVLGAQPSQCLGHVYVGGSLSDGGTFYYLTADDTGDLYRIAPGYYSTIRSNIQQAGTNRIAINGLLYAGNSSLPGSASVPIIDDVQGIGTLVANERVNTQLDPSGCPGAVQAAPQDTDGTTAAPAPVTSTSTEAPMPSAAAPEPQPETQEETQAAEQATTVEVTQEEPTQPTPDTGPAANDGGNEEAAGPGETATPPTWLAWGLVALGIYAIADQRRHRNF